MSDQALRQDVLYLLKGGGAHLSFRQAIEDLPEELRGSKVDGAPIPHGGFSNTCDSASGTSSSFP